MKILQLCMFTNHWGAGYDVESHDIENGKNALELPFEYGKDFDFVLAAPPCTQFTKANSSNWVEYPSLDIEIATHCLRIAERSGKPFVLENPCGRIEKFIPVLKKYRIGIMNDQETNKEWVIYSNQMMCFPPVQRYGKKSITNYGIKKRLGYPKYFIDVLKMNMR